MVENKINLVCLAAGAGARLSDSGKIKPLIDICGKSMLERVVLNIFNTGINFTFCFLKEHEDNYKLSKIVKKYIPDANFVIIPTITEGPAITASLASKYIDDNPLIVINCDQIIEGLNWKDFLVFCANYDGVAGTFDSDNLKNSFARTENGLVVEIREKQKVGEHALNGVHFWKNGLDFLSSVKEMVEANDRYNNEFFIAPSYTHLIKKGAKIGVYKFDNHFPIGIKEDLEIYKRYLRWKKYIV